MAFVPAERTRRHGYAAKAERNDRFHLYKYNADGTLRVNDLSANEILGYSDAGKTSFDHYKGMFGMLAMIRTMAQLYNEATFNTFNTFTKTKIHFLHAQGKLFKCITACVCV